MNDADSLAEKIKIIKPDTRAIEKVRIPIQIVYITPEAVKKFLTIKERYDKNWHDLLVLLGKPNQRDAERGILDAEIVPNPEYSREFKDVFGNAYQASSRVNDRRRGLGLPELDIVGVGTIVGEEEDVQKILTLGKGKFDLFWAGGTELPKFRAAAIPYDNQARIYSLDQNDQVVQLTDLRPFIPPPHTQSTSPATYPKLK